MQRKQRNNGFFLQISEQIDRDPEENVYTCQICSKCFHFRDITQNAFYHHVQGSAKLQSWLIGGVGSSVTF